MKKLFYLLLLFAAVCCRAQQPLKVTQPVDFLRWINVKDSVRASIYFQNTNDTLATRAYARGFAGGGLVAGYGIRVGGDTVVIDTLHYRKMDSLYVVTDSTFIIKINGAVYSYKMRGALFSFNNRIGAIIPNKYDYTPYYPRLDSNYSDPPWITSLDFSKSINLPSTLGGYGIGDGVQNMGGVFFYIADIEANRPPVLAAKGFFFGVDDSVLRYWNGAKYIIAGGGAAQPDSVVNYNYGLLKTTSGTNITVKVDTTTLKSVFGSGSPGVVQLFTKYGLLINGTDTASVDTTIFLRWSDTLSKIASRNYVLTRGFLTSESDPVALAKTITNAGTAGAGILVTGGTQALGTNPGWSYKADTSILATHTALLDTAAAIRAAIPSGSGITQIYTKGGIIVNGTDTVTVDSTKYLRFADTVNKIATQSYVLGKNYLTAETDPIATKDTINLVQVPGAGIAWTGLAKQALGANPTWTIKADTSILSTKFALFDTASILRSFTTTSIAAAPFIPLIWSGNVTVTGNNDTLKINSGFVSTIGAFNRTTIGNGNIFNANSLDTSYWQLASIANDAMPALQISYGRHGNGTGTFPLTIRPDSIIFNVGGTPTYIYRNGTAIFGNHVNGITESTSDSSTRFATTQLIKQLLASYTPGLGSSLTAGSGLTGGSFNGSTAVTFKADTTLLATESYVGRQGYKTVAVDTLYRTPGTAAIFFTINGRTHSILDSVGTGSITRIGPIDSLGRVANALQISGTTLLAQTASHTAPGMESAQDKLDLDSLYGGLLKDTTKVGYYGIGTHLLWSSTAGDSLNTKTVNSPYGIAVATASDSTLNLTADTISANHLITLAYFNAHANQGPGITNLTLNHYPYGDSVLSSTGTGVLIDTVQTPHPGLLSLFNYGRIQHTLIVPHNPAGGDSLVWSNTIGNNDTLGVKNLAMGTGIKDTTTQNLITLRLDTTYTDGRYVTPAQLALKAPLANPALTGIPTAPTAAGGTNTTQLATTAFVTSAVGGANYQQVQTAGTGLTGRPALNFGAEFTAVDNAGATRSDVTINSIAASKISGLHYQTIQANGTGQTVQPILNFGPEFTLTNDNTNTRSTATINSIASSKITGLNYQQIYANLTPATVRPGLNFSSQFTVTDDGSNSSTDIALSASATTTTQSARDSSTKIATTQYVDQASAAGIYLPTITDVGGSTSSRVVDTARWTRVGNIVTVHGVAGLTATIAGQVSVELSLPIPTHITSNVNLSGLATAYLNIGGVFYPGNILGDVSTNQAVVLFNINNTSGESFEYTYNYIIR